MECTLDLPDFTSGFLGSFLAKGFKTNQLEVNTDEKTLRPIARLREPRDLFALPKDKDHDCSQQAPRWPIECQVIEGRIVHIPYVPATPEPYNEPTGDELKPRPVGEENGVVVFNYNPISAVNYKDPEKANSQESSDSDISSSESRGSTPDCSTPDRRKLQLRNSLTKLLETLQPRSSSNSNDEDDDEDEKSTENCLHTPKSDQQRAAGGADDTEIENIWADKSLEYAPVTLTAIRNQFAKDVAPKAQVEIERIEAKTVSPVRFDAAQLADLELSTSLTKTNSSSSVSTDYTDNLDTDEEEDGGKTLRDTSASPKTDTELNSKLKNKPIDEFQYACLPQNSEFKLFRETQACAAEMSNSLDPKDPQPKETATPKPADNKDSTSNSMSPPQFSRSSVGGSRFITNCHPYNPEEYDGLEFESRFESGNLAKAVQITNSYYELYLRSDLYTSRSKQWYYFRVRKTKTKVNYRFSIVNLVKSDSLYNDGMRPLMYSTINAKNSKEGWKRCGTNICYYRNDEENANEDEEDNSSYTLTFNIEFPHDDDTVYFAHSYPYTYSDLQDYLMEIQKDPTKSKFCKLRLLCRSLAGNNVYYLTVTAPTPDEELMKRKKSIVVSGRVHPSETPASWMMKGLMDFITGDTLVAKRLRHKFIFKLIPMLNPDGVIVGNTRNSLTGKDLNRQYRTVIRETYPSIWYTKAMIKRLIDECGVTMYCDMHAHSRKHNIFIYGCENKRNSEKKLAEQVFPLMMHKNAADKFSFENCKFKVQRSKEGTGRIVVWMLGIMNSYTIEASFGGSSLGSRKGTHFNTAERLRLKIIERLLKQGSSADEPLNIPLSDYSSDEGVHSSSSDNENKVPPSFSDLEGPCCAPLKVPPSTPESSAVVRKKKFKRMRKIMHELDRIYFQPLFQKRLHSALKTKKRKQKTAKKSARESATATGNANATVTATATTHEGVKKVDVGRLEGGQAIQSETNSQSEAPSDSKSKRDSQLRLASTEEDTLTISKHSTRRLTKRKKPKHKVQDIPLDKAKASRRSRRVRVSRRMRVWLAAKKIFIYRRKIKNRKIKLRSKSNTHRRKDDLQRTPLDLPTTDPGSDLHFSTDDEQGTDARHDENGCSNVTRTCRYLLHSELQRRYIEEIGDGSNIMKRMPPELIVSSPTERYPVAITYKPAAPKTAPADKILIGEFPLIGGMTRRTNSWHNLNNGGKCTPKLKTQSPFQPSSPFNCQTKEDLELRLSLRKKIWTGVKPDISSNYAERNRPLSWVMPMFGTQLKKETLMPTTNHGFKKDLNEVLFNACSQKLLAWQQETLLTPNKQRGNLTLNLVMPDINNEEKTLRMFKQVSQARSTQKPSMKMESKEIKLKKKKNSVSKIADTTQLITRLAKNKSNNIFTAQRLLKTATPSHSSQKLHKHGINKFKTGGIVVTAVQSNAPKKTRTKLRAITTNASTISNASTLRTTGQPPPRTDIVAPCSLTAAYGNSINLDIRAAMETNTFACKIKTKLKKKSRAANVEADGASLGVAGGGKSASGRGITKKLNKI